MSKKEVVTNTYDEAIARFINGGIDTAEKVGQFAADQLPGFITEVLRWYFTYNLILFVAAVVLSCALLALDYKAYKLAKAFCAEERNQTALVVGWGVFGMFLRLLGWGAGVGSLINLQWLQIWIAPKLWLI
jgi:hypothetical protein